MNGTAVTLMGNLTGDPELRFTPAGVAVVNFTVASTPRTLDKTTDEWVDGETMFVRCTAWRQIAENTAGSLVKGNRVVVTGALKVRTWEGRDGESRLSIECDVDEVAPSLRWATATVTRGTETKRYPASVKAS